MSDTVIVGSRAHTAIRIQEPLPEEFKDKPGNAPPLKSGVLNGSTHTGARSGVGITRGVDASMFRAWHAEQVAAGTPLAQVVFEMSDEDADKDDPTEYGFQPGLDRMEAKVDASGGSAVTHAGPVSSEEMAATSDTPNDDTARGQPDLTPTAHTQEAATTTQDF